MFNFWICRSELAPFTPKSALGAVDVKERDDAYEFDVDVPGLTKDEVKVNFCLYLLLLSLNTLCSH